MFRVILFRFSRFNLPTHLQPTVRDVLDNQLSSLWKQGSNKFDLKKFLREIRSSPEYWAQRKRHVFAMIRQLGLATMFVTLSPAEVDWFELIVVLNKVNGRVITIDEAKQIDRKQRIEMIANDPVTTARYFNNRIRHTLRYMFNTDAGPFCKNPVVDYFWRMETQARGSPHIHMILWLKNAPGYVKGSHADEVQYQNCIEFIDR